MVFETTDQICSDNRKIFSRKSSKKNLMWWKGPAFLAELVDCWPHDQATDSNNIMPEIKTLKVIVRLHQMNQTKFISFQKLQRTMAYIGRFITNGKDDMTVALPHVVYALIHESKVRVSKSRHFPVSTYF
jgi:hypothetical protein